MGNLRITGNQKEALAGEAAPAGGKIEVLNLTYAAGNRVAVDEYVAAGTADASGKFSLPFSGALAHVQEGDYVRVRMKDKDGHVVGTLTQRITGRAAVDTRPAPVVDRRLSLYEDKDGKTAYLWNDPKYPATEPGAVFKLSNPATGKSVTITTDADGNLPKDFGIAGKKGDRLTISTSDGRVISSMISLTVIGKAQHANDSADPSPLKDSLDPSGRLIVGSEIFTGPLWAAKGPQSGDAIQRYIGDCYLPAGAAAIAYLTPKVIKEMFKKKDDGSFDVTFRVRDGDKFVKKVVNVDGDLYINSSSVVIYGASGPSDKPAEMLLWYPLLEKAYAKMHGSYADIGDGGVPETIMEAMLGREGFSVDPVSANALWTVAVKAVNAKLPSSLSTSDDDARYAGTGIHGKHAYSVLGYDYDPTSKQRFLILRNPWGDSEPGSDGKDDGVFKMKVEDAKKLFDTFHSVK